MSEALPPSPPQESEPVAQVGGGYDPREMSFVEHLGELRRALVISAFAIVLGTVAGFAFHNQILNLLMRQAGPVTFVIISPAEGFTAVLRLSVLVGLFLGLPIFLREIVWFVGPALTRRQRLILIPIALASWGLFMVGMIFAYLVLPIGLKYLIGFIPSGITPTISIDRYIGFATTMLLCSGLIFQVPVVMLLLSLFGVLKRAYLVPQRRYAVLISFILGAILTPPDIITQIFLAVPLLFLFEVGLALMWLVEKFRDS